RRPRHLHHRFAVLLPRGRGGRPPSGGGRLHPAGGDRGMAGDGGGLLRAARSEERRVGKECRERWAAERGEKKKEQVRYQELGRARVAGENGGKEDERD